MALILLKSSACLLAFIAFYKVFLERTSSHQFKRFYLLAVVLISIGIPFITFIEYIEPQFILGDFGTSFYNPNEVVQTQVEPKNYLPIILWSIYGIGVLLFGIRFINNLVQIYFKINKNPKQKTANFIGVLLQDYVIPHTFFHYIFLNKTKFENNEIPKEVLLHEETHAKQKHSIDILFIELLQIVFWFNPLVYLLKKDIKLNHEFLADQAVISHGITLTYYQQLLLEFSSNSSTNHLANAINYSLIKKRFTIMKTKTSKQSLWIRSVLLLPLLAILIYGFSTTKQVEKDIVPKISSEDLVGSTTKHTARSIEIQIFNNGTYEVDGIKATNNTFVSVINQLHQDITPELRNKIMNIHLSSLKDISNEEVWFIYNSLLDYGFHRIVTANQEIIREKGNTPFAISSNYTQEYSEAELTSTQKTIPTINGIPCDNCTVNLSRKGIEKLTLGTTQNQSVTNFKIKFSKKPVLAINGNSLNEKAIGYLSDAKIGNSISIFDIVTDKSSLKSNISIQLVIKHDKNYSHSPKVVKGEPSDIPPPPAPRVVKGELSKIPPPPPPIPANASPEVRAKYQKVIQEYKAKQEELELKKREMIDRKSKMGERVKEREHAMKERELKMAEREHLMKERELKREEMKNIPPPPKPPLDHVIDMAKKGATFYYEGKKISSDKAIKFLKENRNLNISTNTNDGVSTVKITKKGITIDD